MEGRAKLELILVVAMMAALFLFGVAAVVIFWRVWRKEKKAKASPAHDADAPE
jgi:flagellar basal body-associated protein FliL